MGMDLMLPFATLINKGELEERPNVGALASEGNEDGDIGGVVFGVLAVGVEIDGPLEAADGEVVAGDVLADADALREGVALYGEVVGPVDGLGQGEG